MVKQWAVGGSSGCSDLSKRECHVKSWKCVTDAPGLFNMHGVGLEAKIYEMQSRMTMTSAQPRCLFHTKVLSLHR